MEPRAVVAAPMGMSDEITIWTSTQIPHVLRVLLALLTGIPENNLRVVAPDVGGGFGAKLQIYREEVLALVLARRLGKPIKWTETRSEHMVATHHGRDQIQDIELAATNDGKILGLKVDLLADMGAYLQIITPGTPAARHVHVLGHLQDGGARLHLHRRLHQQDADRRLPRRRPPGGDVRHRAHRRRAGGRARHRADGVAHEELDQARGVPLHADRGAHLRHRATTRRPPRGPSSCSATTSCAPSRRRVASPATRSSSASASRRSPRCAASHRRAPWVR